MRHGRFVDTIPVLRNLTLRLFESQGSGTHLGMKVIFHSVLGMRAAIRDGSIKWFGPKILGIGRIAAEFERNEVILLVVPQARVGISVFADLFYFQAMRVRRRRSDGLGAPSRITNCFANIFLSDMRIY